MKTIRNLLFFSFVSFVPLVSPFFLFFEILFLAKPLQAASLDENNQKEGLNTKANEKGEETSQNGGSGASSGSSAGAGTNPASKLYGKFHLTTNYVEHGLTYSAKDPAFQPEVGYKMNQFIFGLWGSNVSFGSLNDEHLVLKPKIIWNINFTNNFIFFLNYSTNFFYKSTTRNGDLVDFHFNIFNNHILFGREGNWEGTGASLNYYGFEKNWVVPWDLILDLRIMYNMLGLSGFENYFDIKTALKYKWTYFEIALSNTLTSSASQFNGRGDFFLFFEMSTQF